MPAAGVRWIALLAVLFASPLAAQETSGEILGSVKDPSGSVIVNARVRAVHLASNQVTTALSGLTGEYLLQDLPPGLYTLHIEMTGFRPLAHRRVTVAAGERTRIDSRLEVIPARDSVRVVAEAPLLATSGSASRILIAPEKLVELPLPGGSPMHLAPLAPGVVNLSEGGTGRNYENENLSGFSIHGAAPGTHRFTLDGAVNTGGITGNVAFVPPSAAVAEVRVNTSTFNAQNGFSLGAAVSIGLRSGGSKLHGQLIYGLENPVANANSFFSNKASTGKDNFRENRWSAYASGPVPLWRLRGHTYWMYACEGIGAKQPYRYGNLAYTVPTAAQRGGDFSDLRAFGSQYQIYDPATTRPSTVANRFDRTAFPGNVIPASRISATASAILERYYPLPNVPGAKPTGVNYVIPSPAVNRFQSHLLRLDHHFNRRNRLNARASWSDRTQEIEYRFNGGAGVRGNRQSRGLALSHVVTLRPRLTLDLRYSYTRYVDDYLPPSAGLDLTSLGFSRAFVDQLSALDLRNLMLPDIAPTGYAELNGYAITRSASDIHAGGAGLSRTIGKHALRLGGEHRLYRIASANTGRSSGKLIFSSDWTRGPRDNSTAAPIGQGMASFLLGLPTSGSMEVNPSLAQQHQMSGLYAQDTWRAGKRLTLYLGLRWDHEVPVTERFNRSVRGFDSDAVLPISSIVEANYARKPSARLPASDFHVAGGVTFAGVNGEPRELWQSSRRNLAPRAGFAWVLGKTSVLRAGYGLFYDPARQSAIQTGFSSTTTLVASQDTGRTYISSLENPFPNGFTMPSGASLGVMTNLGQTISVFPERLLNPYLQRWSLSLQQALGRNAVLEAGYVGTRSTHLRVSRQLNAIPLSWLSASPVRDTARYSILTANVTNPFYPLLPSTGLSATTVQLQQLVRPYPQFTGITSTINDGFSWYHGLQTMLQKRFPGDYFVLVSYTWSKLMEATTRMNEADLAPAHAISAYDRAHRIVVASVYELPFGRGKRRRALLSRGWQLHGIYQRQSGAPLSFGNVLFCGGSMKEIELRSGERTPERWFNTQGFERASAQQLVYNLRAFPLRLSGVRSMGLNKLDLGLAKNVKAGETVTIQLRADAFNSLNHTHFGAPNTSPTSTDFGVVTSTSQLPRHIEFALRLRF